ncbi:hypothetical protein [Muricoccus radiodurans]|uniref:hypothetical protein n=1 Tax=Muricoccus radiodurans TaxID=2231721 RepID=UPI003CEE85AB
MPLHPASLQEAERLVAEAETMALAQRATVERLERDGLTWLAPMARGILADLRATVLIRQEHVERLRGRLRGGPVPRKFEEL